MLNIIARIGLYWIIFNQVKTNSWIDYLFVVVALIAANTMAYYDGVNHGLEIQLAKVKNNE